MFLKFEPFASDLCDPGRRLGLQKFCIEQGLAYQRRDVPVPLDTFTRYGLAFQERLVPEVEDSRVVAVDPAPEGGFTLRLETGERLVTRRVVVAVGIAYFADLPPVSPTCRGPAFRTARITLI